MNLQLAIALSCTETCCEALAFGQTDPFHAEFSKPMMEFGLVVRPGDWIVVDRQGDPPQVVFRLIQVKADQVVGGQVFAETRYGKGAPMSWAEGVDQKIVAGDVVFAANGQIFDLAVNGQPVNPERLQAVLFPQVEAIYQQIQVWNALDPKQVVEQGYDLIAERHLEWAQGARSAERAYYTSVLLDRLPAGAHVLDLGCGAGVPTTQELARRFHVTGVDISKHQIALARLNVPAAEFLQGDFTQLSFPPASFDAAIAFYALIHIPREEQAQVLQDIHAWLRPGGLLVATMSTHSVNRDFGEDFLGARMFWSGFDSETNKQMIENAGLRIIRAQEETAVEFERPVTFLWVIANKPGANV